MNKLYLFSLFNNKLVWDSFYLIFIQDIVFLSTGTAACILF